MKTIIFAVIILLLLCLAPALFLKIIGAVSIALFALSCIDVIDIRIEKHKILTDK